MGSFKATIVEPMEVFSIPLQKRAVHLVLVHNHPSGVLKPSDADKDITDRLIQVGRIMKVPILDHLIITENSYYSFANSGLLDELSKSLKYVPAFEIKKRYEKQAEKKGKEKGNREGKKAIAKAMKDEGYPLEEIIKLTGLNKGIIERLK
jgi:DNA repair protein RadC